MDFLFALDRHLDLKAGRTFIYRIDLAFMKLGGSFYRERGRNPADAVSQDEFVASLGRVVNSTIRVSGATISSIHGGSALPKADRCAPTFSALTNGL